MVKVVETKIQIIELKKNFRNCKPLKIIKIFLLTLHHYNYQVFPNDNHLLVRLVVDLLVSKDMAHYQM